MAAGETTPAATAGETTPAATAGETTPAADAGRPGHTGAAGARHFDTRHIPEFSGAANVAEWFTRAEKLCRRRGVSFTEVLPERLTGAAFAVWDQLSDEAQDSMETVRDALYDAFALNRHAAYAAFQNRELQPGESADTYLADLRRLIALVSDDAFPDSVLDAKFISGLPAPVRSQLKAGTRAQRLPLSDLVKLTREILSDEQCEVPTAAAVAVTARPASSPSRRGARPSRPPRRCWTCGREGHLAAACPNGQETASARAPSPSG